MLDCVLLVATFLMTGIEAAYVPTDEGGGDYLVRVEPDLVKSSSPYQFTSDVPADARPWLALALVRQQQGNPQAAQQALVQARSRLGGQGADRLDQVAVSWGLAGLRGPSGAPTPSAGPGPHHRRCQPPRPRAPQGHSPDSFCSLQSTELLPSINQYCAM